MRAIGARAIGVELAPGERRRIASADGATIFALGLPHGNSQRRRQPANLGYVVDVGGRRVLHIGDTGAGVTEFAALRLDELGIDVALLPDWYLTTPELREVVRRVIRPASIAVVHVSAPSALARWLAREQRPSEAMVEIRRQFPNARGFMREMETMVVR
jgi:L-ascorbate metabolism protein UlaG (beta-lactamase superfamily)